MYCVDRSPFASRRPLTRRGVGAHLMRRGQPHSLVSSSAGRSLLLLLSFLGQLPSVASAASAATRRLLRSRSRTDEQRTRRGRRRRRLRRRPRRGRRRPNPAEKEGGKERKEKEKTAAAKPGRERKLSSPALACPRGLLRATRWTATRDRGERSTEEADARRDRQSLDPEEGGADRQDNERPCRRRLPRPPHVCRGITEVDY